MGIGSIYNPDLEEEIEVRKYFWSIMELKYFIMKTVFFRGKLGVNLAEIQEITYQLCMQSPWIPL